MGNGNILVPLDRVEDVEKKVDELNSDIGNVDTKIGSLSSLTTSVKTSIVNAINSLVTSINTLTRNFKKIDVANASLKVLDNTVHACTTNNTPISFTVPNLNKYRYIKLFGTCGDGYGNFELVIPTFGGTYQFNASNFSSSSYWANALVRIEFQTNTITIMPQVSGWSANTISIQVVWGALPI